VHDIEKMTRKPAPVIGLIDSIEFTITSLLRDNMQFESGEITAVISINSNCTKLFFLNGNELFHISPIIYSGVQHRGSANKIYAKVLYELSNEAITGLDRIVILGDDEKNSYKEFFAAKFPDLAIDDLSSLHFHDLMSEPIVDNVLSRYYLAIALALKSANLNNANYYPTNFVPAKVKEKQSVFSIGWHGYLMLAILFICVLGVSVQNRKVSNELKVSQLSLLDIDELKSNLNTLYLQGLEYFGASTGSVNNLIEDAHIEESMLKGLDLGFIPNFLNSLVNALSSFSIGLFSVLFISPNGSSVRVRYDWGRFQSA